MTTEPARIVQWIISKLEENAPFPTLEDVLKEAEQLAEEVEEQSRGGITKDEILEWLEDYIDDLIALTTEKEEESYEEMYERAVREIKREIIKIRERYGLPIEEYEEEEL